MNSFTEDCGVRNLNLYLSSKQTNDGSPGQHGNAVRNRVKPPVIDNHFGSGFPLSGTPGSDIFRVNFQNSLIRHEFPSDDPAHRR